MWLLQSLVVFLSSVLIDVFDHLLKQKQNGFFLFSVGFDEFENRNNLKSHFASFLSIDIHDI